MDSLAEDEQVLGADSDDQGKTEAEAGSEGGDHAFEGKKAKA